MQFESIVKLQIILAKRQIPLDYSILSRSQQHCILVFEIGTKFCLRERHIDDKRLWILCPGWFLFKVKWGTLNTFTGINTTYHFFVKKKKRKYFSRRVFSLRSFCSPQYHEYQASGCTDTHILRTMFWIAWRAFGAYKTTLRCLWLQTPPCLGCFLHNDSWLYVLSALWN